MSRTSVNNANRVPTPVKYFVSFTKDGDFSYWNKEAGERVSLGETIKFVLMDTRSAVGGWHEADGAGARVYSNRVKSTVDEELNVRCGKEVLAKGLWADIKDKVKAAGGKFCTELFVLVEVDGKLEPAQMDFMGSSLGDWMTFVEELGGKWAVYKSLVVATKGEKRKKGSNVYYGINFTTEELSAEASEAANIFNDDKLQPYLNAGVAEPVVV